MLTALGIGPADQALYEFLLTRPPTTTVELETFSDGQPWAGNVGSAMDRLEAAGLVTSLPGDPPRHLVVSADVALNALIAARERALAATRQHVERIVARLHGSGDNVGVEVVHGRDAARWHHNQLQHGARREVLLIDAPPYLGNAPEYNPTEFELLRRGVRYRVLYDRSAMEVPGRLANLEECAAAGEEARITEVPMKLVIGDQPLASMPLRAADPTAWLMISDPALCVTLAALFDSYWEHAWPFQVARGNGSLSHGGLSESERALLTLLVSGLTDRAIAEQLGVHERTAHRRLRSLMTHLDAATRFQAGYQAARRGWLTTDGGDARVAR